MDRIAIVRHYDYKNNIKSCEIVRKYIIKNKFVIYGGESIDYALKIYGNNNGIYKDYEVPDYDFYAPNNVIKSYELFKEFINIGYSPVSVLPAIHPTTMRVKVHDLFVADLSYVDILQYKLYKKTAINYKDALSKHPILQNADQNRSMCFPYENEGAEVILHRWKKDFERINKLYKYYKIIDGKSNEMINKLLKSLKYPNIEQIIKQKITINLNEQNKSKSIIEKLNKSKIDYLICGKTAFNIYLDIFRNIDNKITNLNVDCIAMDKERIIEFIGSEKYKIEYSPGHMIGKKYITKDMIFIELEHRTTYHCINEFKIASINYMIIWAFSNLLRDYTNERIETLGKKTESISMYLQLLNIQQCIYSRKFKNKYKIFYPSIIVIGDEQENLMEYDKELLPPRFFYRDDIEKDELLKEVPSTYKYSTELL